MLERMKKDILSEIVAAKRVEVAERKNALPPAEMYRRAEACMEAVSAGREPSPRSCGRSMRGALAASASGIIAEFKRRSPSKGWIHESALPEEVIPRYAAVGATALSILTDEAYFGGSLDYIARVRPAVPGVPVLRKDFIVDEYQLFEARAVGADAVLLIAAALDLVDCRRLLQTAHSLGLEVLLEIHEEKELDYVSVDTDMVGVNNRHLGTFHTDVEQSFFLADKLPAEVVRVSESGISDPATVHGLREAGYRGFLIGEHFMREAEPARALQRFVESVERLGAV